MALSRVDRSFWSWKHSLWRGCKHGCIRCRARNRWFWGELTCRVETHSPCVNALTDLGRGHLLGMSDLYAPSNSPSPPPYLYGSCWYQYVIPVLPDNVCYSIADDL